MAYLKTLERSRRIGMFLQEYYFGNKYLVNIIRLLAGPCLVSLGILLLTIDTTKASIAYAGAIIFYGLYYGLKPLFWVLLKEDNFKTLKVSVEIKEGKIRFTEENSEAEITLGTLRKILKRKDYYVLEVAKYTRMYVPFNLLSGRQCITLDEYLKDQ